MYLRTSRLGAFVRVSPIASLPQLRDVSTLPASSRFGIPPRIYVPRPRPVRSRPGFRGLGQFTETLMFPPSDQTDQIPSMPPVSADTAAQINAAVASITPTTPAGQPQGPIAPVPSVNYTTSTMTLDPLNFVSPQSAIAAGVNPTQTYAAWNKAVGSFPTQQAAIAAGIPAGVVTQLWASSRSAMPATAPSWFDQTTFGIKNIYLAAGAGLLALVAASSRGRRR